MALKRYIDMQYLVDEFEKSLPPMGHPLRKLGVRLTELLDEDQWAECERLLLEGWELDAADRATGARWRANRRIAGRIRKMSTDTTHAPIGADAVREALKWAAAALQAIAPDEDTVRDNATGETRSVGQILDAADAALASAAQPAAVPPEGFVVVPVELAKRVQESLGEFLMDHGWSQRDMDTSDEFDAVLLASAPKAAPARWYMVNKLGMATLCADWKDAEQAAADAQAAWPHAGPHRAVQMREVAAAPAPSAPGDANT